ncbi:MAG: Gfo/Idh/MocA family oxidoreductase [Armatimonas sp.]
MGELQFVMLGAGFWAGYQLAAWQEIPGARCIGVCAPDRVKAEALASQFGISGMYTDPTEAIAKSGADFIDIVTPPATHPELVRLALSYKKPTICQKPLAETLADAEALVAEAQAAEVPLLVHENWRWQAPLRALKAELDSGVIGEVFRARLTMVSGFPLFINQPGLKKLERFLLADIGVHVLDTARFLFGEADQVYCHLRRVQPDIAGEDAATILTQHSHMSVITELGYVQNFYERDRFPQTFAFIEGAQGSIDLATDYWLRTTTKDGTYARRVSPPRYRWANPEYDVVHASMVPCLTNLLAGIRGEPCETTAADNLKTLQLIEGAYQNGIWL